MTRLTRSALMVARVLTAILFTVALLFTASCGVQGQSVTGKWVNGPDKNRQVFCVGGDSSISCDWIAYHKGERTGP